MFDRCSESSVGAVDEESYRYSFPIAGHGDDLACIVGCTTTDAPAPWGRTPAAVDTHTRNSLAMVLAVEYCSLR